MRRPLQSPWYDAEKKLSKRRPENPPALDSSSREVNSRVEALRFDRRAGGLALHLSGFSNHRRRSLLFGPGTFLGVFCPLCHGVLYGSSTTKTQAPVEAGIEPPFLAQFPGTSPLSQR